MATDRLFCCALWESLRCMVPLREGINGEQCCCNSNPGEFTVGPIVSGTPDQFSKPLNIFITSGSLLVIVKASKSWPMFVSLLESAFLRRRLSRLFFNCPRLSRLFFNVSLACDLFVGLHRVSKP